MSDQYVGEIRMVGFNFAPVGWALCNGQLLGISANAALFSLLGTSFGGNGTSNFGLPNLQTSAPLHWGNGNGLSPTVIGQAGGEPSVSLLQNQIPAHNHGVACLAGAGRTGSPTGGVWADDSLGRGIPLYATTPGTSPGMAPTALQITGGTLPHNNMPPFLTIYFIIALQGLYPPRG
jgi:microcystin-dependent protein